MDNPSRDTDALIIPIEEAALGNVGENPEVIDEIMSQAREQLGDGPLKFTFILVDETVIHVDGMLALQVRRA